MQVICDQLAKIQVSRTGNTTGISRTQNRIFTVYDRFSLEFFFHRLDIDILNFHERLTIPVSSEFHHGCYHKKVSGIQPYFYPWVKEICFLHEFIIIE